MKYGRYGLSYMFLRWGLGLTFIYIGLDIFFHPDLWLGYVPDEVPFGLARGTTLRAAGLFDLAVGALMIIRFMPKLMGFLAAVHLISVAVFNGLDAVLIRNVGLLGAAMAVWFWPAKHHRRRLMPKFLRKKKRVYEDDE